MLAFSASLLIAQSAGEACAQKGIILVCCNHIFEVFFKRKNI
jgi:hypothetical protein